MKTITLNKGVGSVTMPYHTYIKLFHDSLLLHILLRQQIEPESARTNLLQEYIKHPDLGKGFMDAQSPLCDADAFKFVYGNQEQNDRADLRERYPFTTLPTSLVERLFEESVQYNYLAKSIRSANENEILCIVSDVTKREEINRKLTENGLRDSLAHFSIEPGVATSAYIELTELR